MKSLIKVVKTMLAISDKHTELIKNINNEIKKIVNNNPDNFIEDIKKEISRQYNIAIKDLPEFKNSYGIRDIEEEILNSFKK